MKNRVFVGFVMRKQTVLLILCLLGILGIAAVFPSIQMGLQRHLFGVKPGVTLAGQEVAGLLRSELYDAVAGLAENRTSDARNATWDWDRSAVLPEVQGQVVDLHATVEQLLLASPGEALELLTIPVLPAIRSSDFSPYRRGNVHTSKVSLMINVDWGDEHIPAMLETLAHFNVTATWFLTGRWVTRSPDLATQITAAGHEIGNHGGWHGLAGTMDIDTVRQLICEGERAILDVVGHKPTLFAPPAGDFNQETVVVAAELGYKTILWTTDTIDWQRPSPTTIIDRVMGGVKNGALVLMHPTKPTAEALPVLIQRLQDAGYQLVSVSENLSSEVD